MLIGRWDATSPWGIIDGALYVMTVSLGLVLVALTIALGG